MKNKLTFILTTIATGGLVLLALPFVRNNYKNDSPLRRLRRARRERRRIENRRILDEEWFSNMDEESSAKDKEASVKERVPASRILPPTRRRK